MSNSDWIAEQALRKRVRNFIAGASEEVRERIISRDAESSYDYARNKASGRWEPGEKAISGDAEAAYEYAVNVIEGRWEPGEKSISGDAECSYQYAVNVICGRWEMGEEAISTSTRHMYHYAKDVIGGRLPDPLHNKMVMLNYSDDADDWVKKYCKAKKYMVRRRKKKAS